MRTDRTDPFSGDWSLGATNSRTARRHRNLRATGFQQVFGRAMTACSPTTTMGRSKGIGYAATAGSSSPGAAFPGPAFRRWPRRCATWRAIATMVQPNGVQPTNLLVRGLGYHLQAKSTLCARRAQQGLSPASAVSYRYSEGQL